MSGKMRSIDIDFAVHQRIEAVRRNFDDPPNTVLRRLLGIGEPEMKMSSLGSGNGCLSLGNAWKGKGVLLPEGTELQVDYSGIRSFGHVVGGKLKFGDMEYNSPSRAVNGVVAEHRGNRVSTNGWKHLYVKRPSDLDWLLADELRTKSRFRS